jgi:hypothetical protein
MIVKQSEVQITIYEWQGFLNIFRRLFGKPIAVDTIIEFEFDNPIVLAPGESIKINIIDNLTINQSDLTTRHQDSEESS